jgi:glutaredoxin
MHDVVLYTRRGCHLCDQAAEILLRHGLQPRMVDIDCEPALRDKFDTCVPVVEIDGQVRFRGRVNEVLLRRLLRAADPMRRQAETGRHGNRETGGQGGGGDKR